MQKDIYQQLLNLIGRPRVESLERFQTLIETLNEKPIKTEITKRFWDYTFPNAGISAHFDSAVGLFEQICLHLVTASVKQGSIKPYDGNLPYGILFEDPEEEVEKKCPGATMSVKDYRTDVDLRPLEVQFCFGAPDFNQPGIGPRRLMMVSIGTTRVHNQNS